MTYKHRRRTLPAIGLMAFFMASLSGGGPSLVTGAAAAKKVKWTGVATGRGGGHWHLWEWIEKRIPEITNGEVEVEVTTYGEIGIGGTEMIRILKAGLVDIVDVNGGYVAGDWPVIEGTELHGVTKSPEELEAVYDAFLRNVVAPREDIMGGKVLASYYWNDTFCFTSFPVNSLEDLKGRRIRVNSANLAQYMGALGAEPLQIPGPEVYNALQKGVAEGGCFGPDRVGAWKLWEITPHMTDLGLSGSGGYVVVSRRRMITPPVGINLFVLQGVRMRDPNAPPGRGILDVYMGALPFVVAMLVCLALILAFPEIAVWLVGTADFT